MSDWTQGYVAEIDYTHGYYSELNPQRIKLAFLNAGLAFPEVGSACELGFGQGVSANMHAAASLTQWSGTDFNPGQAAFAQELQSASGAQARWFDESFEEFASRPDLPEFDYIGLHGIWSWVSDTNRAVIVDFLRRKLKVGGVFYVSYNTLPGWAAFAPVRHLITQHAQHFGARGKGMSSRVDEALAFADTLMATKPVYGTVNSSVAARLEALKAHSRHYLAHEYFNKDWHPMYFADMAQWMGQAKLEFACSAHYLDCVEPINVTAEQQQLLDQITDPLFKQSIRDFVVNQQFRRDYWVKGKRKLSKLAQNQQLEAQQVLLVAHRPDIKLTVQGALGEANLFEGVYNPLLDLLSDHKPMSIGQLADIVQAQGITRPQVVQAAMVLIGAGYATAVQTTEPSERVRAQTERLNAMLMHKAKGDGQVAYLASPLSGGGFAVGRFTQLFLLAIKEGHLGSGRWAKYVWDILSAQGQKIIKDGQVLSTEQENLAELASQAQEFERKVLPVLRALLVA